MTASQRSTRSRPTTRAGARTAAGPATLAGLAAMTPGVDEILTPAALDLLDALVLDDDFVEFLATPAYAMLEA